MQGCRAKLQAIAGIISTTGGNIFRLSVKFGDSDIAEL